MALDSPDVVTASSSIGHGFSSCSAVGGTLGSDPYFWCFEMEENDYLQVLIIALFFVLMSAGHYLLTYGAVLWGLTSMKGIHFPTGTRPPRNEQTQLSMIMPRVPQLQWFDDTISTQLALPAYLCMYVLMTSVHLLIKIYIASTESSHYIWSMDDRFEEQGFASFVNARVIIMIGIFLLNTIIFWCGSIFLICTACTLMIGTVHRLPCFLMCCWICISLLDAVFSIIICCVFYPMIISVLYFVAVAFLVNVTLMFFCCCITPCLSFACSKLRDHIVGLHRMRYDEYRNAHIQCMSPLSRFGYSFGCIALFISWIYAINCVALVYVFSFLDGPKQSVVYVDFNNTDDRVVLALYASTVLIGCIGLCMSVIFSCLRHQQLEIENAEFEETVQQRHNSHESESDALIGNVDDDAQRIYDPFSDPNIRGFRLLSHDHENNDRDNDNIHIDPDNDDENENDQNPHIAL